jgi:hypothetical protein
MGREVKNCTKEDIFLNHKTSYYLLKLVGLAPLSLLGIGQRSFRLENLKYGICYSIAIALSILSATSYVFLLTAMRTLNISRIYLLALISSATTTVIILAVNVPKVRTQINQVLFKISKIHLVLNTQGKILVGNRKFVYIQVVSLLILYTIFFIFDICLLNKGVAWNVYIIPIDIAVFIQFVPVVQFVNFVLLIRQRLRVLKTFISSPEFCPESNYICDPWGVICQRMSIQNVQIIDNNMKHFDTF